MTSEVALPNAIAEIGTIVTLIIPAPNGCNLSCPFCFIRQRGEDQAEPVLKPKDYVHFIKQVAVGGPVAAVCIQGYEPLLLEAMAYTRSILATGRRLGIPTSLVTNGVELANALDELAALGIAKIAVSIDADDPESHDRQRGKVGAWSAAIEGIRQAVKKLPVSTELTVTSVLIPKRRHYLEGMPALLRDLGVKRWVVNALRKIEPGHAGRPWGDRSKILGDLAVLQRIADWHGVDFCADDEFDTLRLWRSRTRCRRNRGASDQAPGEAIRRFSSAAQRTMLERERNTGARQFGYASMGSTDHGCRCVHTLPEVTFLGSMSCFRGIRHAYLPEVAGCLVLASCLQIAANSC